MEGNGSDADPYRTRLLSATVGVRAPLTMTTVPVGDLGGEVRVPEMADAQARKAESDATRTTGFLQVKAFPDPNALQWPDAQAKDAP